MSSENRGEIVRGEIELPRTEHQPEDPMKLKRFRAHPKIKAAKQKLREAQIVNDPGAKGLAPPADALAYYNKVANEVRKELGIK